MLRAAAGRGVKAAIALHGTALAILIVRPRPVGQRVTRAVLVAALRHRIEDAVDAERPLTAARIARIGVEDITRLVAVEDAVSGEILKLGGPFLRTPVVVFGAPGGDVFRPERDPEVVVELVVE